MLRLALLLLFTFLAYSPRSDAACVDISATQLQCGSQGEAVAYAFDYLSRLQANPSAFGTCGVSTTVTQILPSGTQDRFWIYTTPGCVTNVSAFYPKAQTCSQQPPLSGTGDFNAGEDGDLRCFSGCRQQLSETATDWEWNNTGGTCALNYDWGAAHCPSGYAWNSTFAVCTPLPPDADGDGVPDSEDAWPFDPTRTADTDGDGIADEFDAFPSDPGENADTDGDGVGDNGDFKPNDPNNGKDGGTGNETDNVSTGGGNCNTPPNSTGDAILAQIAYQAWATRCATTTGNAKLDAIKTATDEVKAAIQAQGAPVVNVTVDGGSGISGDVSGMSLDEGVSGIAPGFPGGEGTGEGEEPSFDSTGFFGGARTCPELPVINVLGAELDFNAPGLCTFFSIGSALVLLFAAVVGMRIIGGAI